MGTARAREKFTLGVTLTLHNSCTIRPVRSGPNRFIGLVQPGAGLSRLSPKHCVGEGRQDGDNGTHSGNRRSGPPRNGDSRRNTGQALLYYRTCGGRLHGEKQFESRTNVRLLPQGAQSVICVYVSGNGWVC